MSTTAVRESAPPASRPDEPVKPSALSAARGAGVVVAGPLLLDALEVLGPLSALRRWPQRVRSERLRTVGQWLTVAGVVAPLLDHGVARPWLRRWGSTPQERQRRLPGDTERRALLRATRAVTVLAPPEEVWRWLVQIGQDRGGFYSYDWLENLAGCDLRSADDIREEWQERVAGDDLVIFPGIATHLTEVSPPYALVIEGWGAYVIEPVDDSRCRLIARSSAEPDAAGLLTVLLIELPHAIMERRMLLGIKERAERRRRAAGRAGAAS